jgi:hypothetical protein
VHCHDGFDSEIVRLEDPSRGLLITSGVWRRVEALLPGRRVYGAAFGPNEEDEYVRLDQQRIGVESGVVDQVRRQPECPERERSAIREEATRLTECPNPAEEARLLRNARGALADIDRTVGSTPPTRP